MSSSRLRELQDRSGLAVTRVLTKEILADFDDALASVDAAIRRVWRPGLDDDAIEAATAPFGLSLPDEARLWWRWHNGVIPETSGSDWELTPGRLLYDLDMTLKHYGEMGPLDEQLDGATARLRFVGEQPWIFLACDGPREDPVPIYVGGHGVDTYYSLPSLGELVIVWTELITTGVYRTDANGHWTNDHWPRLPEHVQKLGVY